MKRLIPIVFAVLIALPTYGQSEGELAKFLEDYVAAINNLTKTKDPNEVLKFLDPGLKGYRVRMGLAGRLTTQEVSKNYFSKAYSSIGSLENVELKIKIEDILEEHKRKTSYFGKVKLPGDAGWAGNRKWHHALQLWC